MTEENIALWGWDDTNKVWVKLAVTGAGALVIDMAGISLNDIGNINAPAPNDGDALVWDDATSLWIPAVAVAAAHEATHVSGGSDDIDSALAIAAMANLSNTMIWQGNAGNRPVEVALPAAGAPTSSGSYTGNDTVNRAIPHGLGVRPKIVILSRDVGVDKGLIMGQIAVFMFFGAVDDLRAVTIPNATNFYVGNAADYRKTMNRTPDVYYWAAIG